MQTAINPKVICMYSPMSQSGQTTVANMIALNLARRGSYTLVIELTFQTGYSMFLNKTLTEMERSLKDCLINPERLKHNVVRSSLDHRMFILTQNLFSTLGDLTDSYNSNLLKVISEAKKIFDYVILDIPNKNQSEAVMKILGRPSVVNHTIYTITENALAIKNLNEFDSLLAKMRNITTPGEREDTTLLVNRSRGYYSNYFNKYLKNMERSKIVNLVNIEDIPELVYLGNEGRLLTLGKSEQSYNFFETISTLTNIVQQGVKGIGVEDDTNNKTKEKLKGSRLIGGKSKEDEELNKLKREGRRGKLSKILSGDKSKKDKNKNEKSSKLKTKKIGKGTKSKKEDKSKVLNIDELLDNYVPIPTDGISIPSYDKIGPNENQVKLDNDNIVEPNLMSQNIDNINMSQQRGRPNLKGRKNQKPTMQRNRGKPR